MAKTKTKRKLKKNNLFIIFSLMFIILMIVGYFILGLLVTAFMGVGILIILGIAKLVDSVKNKPKQKKDSKYNFNYCLINWYISNASRYCLYDLYCNIS